MIRIEHLHAFKGDSKVTINDDDPEKRSKLAQHIMELIKLGHAVFVEVNGETHRVRGYDALDNSWIVGDSSKSSAPADAADAETVPKKKRGQKKVPAAGTVATTVPSRARG